LEDLIDHKPVVIPKSIGVGLSPSKHVWLFGGSAPLEAPDPDPGTGLPRGILNTQNYIFAFNRTKTEDSSELTLGNLQPLKYENDNNSALPNYGDTLTSGDNKLDPNAINGWYLGLRPADSIINAGTTTGTRPEYVTTSPYLYYGTLYVSTFIPLVRGTDEYEVCPDLGHAKLYAINPLTGEGKWGNGKQAIVLKDIKITGVAAAGGNLYLGIQALSSTALNGLTSESGLGVSQDGSMLILSTASMPPAETTLSPEEPYIQYWRDIVNP
jgi:Tfp pilus tip-associated adhesin PilY1